MKNLTQLILLFLLIAPAVLQAQDELQTNHSASESFTQPSPLAIKLQYVGEFVLHPGLTVGTDYTIYSNDWFHLHWDTELGGYVHTRNNTSFFTQTTVGTRFVAGFGLFADIQVGVGYMVSMPQGDVYRADDTGDIQLGGRTLTGHFKPTFSFLMGWDGMRRSDVPLRIFTGLEAYMQSGYNHVLLPHAAFRLGVAYQL